LSEKPAGDNRPQISQKGVAMNKPTEFDPKMLEALVCPLTQTSLAYDAENSELVSRSAKLAFPIRDGIPVMLIDEARTLD
jgi:hypothetical protein